jgi:tRNA threonylcarbamoyladenosine biosynthesis protein TsaB
MATFISIQSTYHSVELALYRDTICLDFQTIEKTIVSKALIITLEHLLASCQTTYEELDFFAVNQGPGPFTTLRVVITTVNGLSFATQLPLFGINALQALIQEYRPTNPDYGTIALLNAFGNDVYFAIQYGTHEAIYGYAPIDTFLANLDSYAIKKWYFVGNGAELYKDKISNHLKDFSLFADPLPHTCSLAQIARMGYAQWQQKNAPATHLSPLYLKKPYVNL